MRYELEQEREFAAAPDEVFAWLTEPAKVATWWGPRGFTTPEIFLDLRVGGHYRFTMQPADGEAFHLSGTYREIEPPQRLSFTFRWDEPTADDRETVVLLVLSASNRGTKVSLSQQEFATEERLELHRQGWAESFDRLDSALRA